MKHTTIALVAAMLCAGFTVAGIWRAADTPPRSIRSAVDGAILPLMRKDRIPGMAVAVTVDGKSSVYSYGVASMQARAPVTRDTLFEIGSVSKTFTATLASLAQTTHHLSLSDKAEKYLPYLRNSAFGAVTLLALGTHTPGGLPLQVPENVRTRSELTAYLKAWRPAYPPGTYRTYSNIGAGMLGAIAAKSLGESYTAVAERRLFPALGLTNTFLNVPARKMAQYAQGYTAGNTAIRMSAGVLSPEAYGVRSTAADMIRFLEANMGETQIDPALQRAVMQTHTGYFAAGPMIQDLIWEQYPYPVSLKALLAGNGPAMLFKAVPVTALKPYEAPAQNVWIDKTGSTNGFAAYVAFVPEKRLGIVILANKNYPIGDRVSAAYRILTRLAGAR